MLLLHCLWQNILCESQRVRSDLDHTVCFAITPITLLRVASHLFLQQSIQYFNDLVKIDRFVCFAFNCAIADQACPKIRNSRGNISGANKVVIMPQITKAKELNAPS